MDILSLLSNLWSYVLVAVFFGGSIFVHELGHFLAARRRGAKVERFSIGFGPAIWSRRGKDGVEYRLSWIPLGGYVLLPQLADLGPIEGESASDVKKLPTLDYASKMLILVAGAAFNILFAIVLACIIWTVGQPVLADLNTTKLGTISPTIKLPDGTTVPNPAAKAGLLAGDVVRSVDGRSVTNFEDILRGVALGSKRAADGQRESVFEVERDGRTLTVTVNPILLSEDKIRYAGVEPPDTFLVVDGVAPGSPAEAAGIRSGDRLLALDGKIVLQRSTVSEHLNKNFSRPSEFLLQRGTEQVTVSIQPRTETDTTTGKQIYRVGIIYRNVVTILHPTPWAQIVGAGDTMVQTLSALMNRSSDVDASKMQGVVGIARELHQQAQWDWRRAMWFAIIINVNLAIFNLLPIPVLDGGHILFATIGRLRRRELPAKFIMTTQSVFLVLIMSFMLYVNFFDVRRWSREGKDRAAPAATTGPAPAPAPAVPVTTPAAPAGK